MQSVDYNDKVMLSEIGDQKKILQKSIDQLKNPKVKKITIANFTEGETIELKGLQFKISSINQRKKRINLEML